VTALHIEEPEVDEETGQPPRTMPHFRALISDLHPNVTVRQLTLAAGLDANRIAYYLKPSTHIDQMPKLAVLKDIARALHCDLGLVVEAFAHDLGIPYGPPLEDRNARRLLVMYNRLVPRDKGTLLRVAQSLAGGG
jgi:hypothetical protein